MENQYVLRHDPADPAWADRDRVLCVPGAATPGTGQDLACPPGLAFGAALGLALAERALAARFGRSLVDHRTWLVADAAELAAGTSHEAAYIAGAMGIGRLTVLAAVPQADAAALARFTAIGWTVRRMPIGTASDFEAAISAALRAQKPTLVALITPDTAPPVSLALGPAARCPGARRSWLKRLRRHASSTAFQQALSGNAVTRAVPLDTLAHGATPAEAFTMLLARATSTMPEITLLPPPATAASGTTLHDTDSLWSHRPLAHSAALLGMALHGGVLPAGRFSARAAEAIRPVERIAASQGVCVVHIVYDCPPCVAGSLQAGAVTIGNLSSYYPATAAEAMACGSLVLRSQDGPSTVLLGPPFVAERAASDIEPATAEGCARGGYLYVGAAAAMVTLIASGPAISLAVSAGAALASAAVSSRVVSVPSWDLFLAQPAPHRTRLLGPGLRVALIANSNGVAASLLRPDDLVVNVTPVTSELATPASAVAARILRHLARNPAILEDFERLLETNPDMD